MSFSLDINDAITKLFQQPSHIVFSALVAVTTLGLVCLVYMRRKQVEQQTTGTQKEPEAKQQNTTNISNTINVPTHEHTSIATEFEHDNHIEGYAEKNRPKASEVEGSWSAVWEFNSSAERVGSKIQGFIDINSVDGDHFKGTGRNREPTASSTYPLEGRCDTHCTGILYETPNHPGCLAGVAILKRDNRKKMTGYFIQMLDNYSFECGKLTIIKTNNEVQ